MKKLHKKTDEIRSGKPRIELPQLSGTRFHRRLRRMDSDASPAMSFDAFPTFTPCTCS
jgi:hypothetical protein